ncbi:MAG: hydantoinase/oxoprolinase family protein [Chloroflexota bacterium]
MAETKRGASKNGKRQEICYIDCGGTFTDAFIVDSDGSYVVAKTPTTPANVAEGFYNTLTQGAEMLGMKLEDLLGQLDILGFGSTIAVNTLLTRSGRKTGVIITKGFEDLFEMQRGLGTWIHLPPLGRVHPQAHEYGAPVVPRWLVKGATERVDCLGQVLIPVYEDEVRQAAKELLDEGVGAIVVCGLYGYLNNANEKKMAAITRQIVGDKVEVLEAAAISPSAGEFARACTGVIEAYTAPKLKNSLRGIYRDLKTKGYKKDLVVMQSMGGVSSSEWVLAVDTIQSGPVGGLIGGKYLGDLYGYRNIVTSDVGGTSFDVGLIVDGMFRIISEPPVEQMLVGHPIAEILSIGAGGGSIAGIEPLSGSFYVGPDSASSVPGPACYDRGGVRPTVTDADLVLGYFDPDYFLGGRMKINKQKSIDAIEQYVAKPLGLTLLEAAAGIRTMIDTKMCMCVNNFVTAKGYDPHEFVLLAFGSGGPTHVAGYTQGIPFKEIMALPYAAGFSCFGACCSDIAFTHIRSVSAVIPAGIDDSRKVAIGAVINKGWEELEKPAYEILEKQGFPRSDIQIVRTAFMKYGKQLHEIMITSPVDRIRTPQDFDALVAVFERDYEKMYTYAARYPGAGFEVASVGIRSWVTKVKPKLVKHRLGSRTPVKASLKGRRDAYFGGCMTPVEIWDMQKLTAGNSVPGPCVIESPTTNMVVPPNTRVEVDQYLSLLLKRES